MQREDLIYRPDLLAGQRILITGGGTGLGRVMAEACLLLGAQVVISGRRKAVLQETAAALTQAHGGTGAADRVRYPPARGHCCDG